MHLGIEIGGTKLQLAVGAGQRAELLEVRRAEVNPQEGAAGILRQIAELGRELIATHPVERIGIGFGGPVDAPQGRAIVSHQITGWDNFPLVAWCHEQFGLPAVIGNDCDVAALAEACWGAGQGQGIVFYVTVGTGVGGGLVIHGRLHGQGRPAVAEIGHLRPGPQAVDPHTTVESRSSGWGIANAARRQLELHEDSMLTGGGHAADQQELPSEHDLQDLLNRCGHDRHALTAKQVAAAALAGNQLAGRVLDEAIGTLGWAMAQVITLVAADVVVVGGGVSLIGEPFFRPLREAVARYVFPPLAGAYRIEPAQLGEEVVLYGAIALSAQRQKNEPQSTQEAQR